MSSALQAPLRVLNLQNRSGETVLGWVLKFAASGLLDEATTLRLTKRMLDLGAIATLPAFEERVRAGEVGACLAFRGLSGRDEIYIYFHTFHWVPSLLRLCSLPASTSPPTLRPSHSLGAAPPPHCCCPSPTLLLIRFCPALPLHPPPTPLPPPPPHPP